MKIYSIAIYHAALNAPATLLAAHADLSSYSFYQRGSVQELLDFFSKTLVERTSVGQRQAVEKQPYKFSVHNRGGADNLAAVIITDSEYPTRPAFSLLQKVLDDFSTQVPRASFTDPSRISFPQLATYVSKYQDPRKADAIMRVQQELDDTKAVLNKTIESVLQRGEKIDDLVERSNDLSEQTKLFLRMSRKQNSCCVIA